MLWNHCDDEGRHLYDALSIKSEVFPADMISEDAVETWLSELVDKDLITKYEVSGESYLFINKWHHQKIDRPSPSRYPKPPKKALSKQTVKNNSMNARRTNGDASMNDRPKEGKGEDSIGKERSKTLVTQDVTFRVFEYWRFNLNHKKAKLTDKRKRVIARAIKDGYTVDDMMRAITGCGKTPFNMGDNEHGRVYDSIELILRDAEHIEKFMEHADNPPKRSSGKLDVRQHNIGVAREMMK